MSALSPLPCHQHKGSELQGERERDPRQAVKTKDSVGGAGKAEQEPEAVGFLARLRGSRRRTAKGRDAEGQAGQCRAVGGGGQSPEEKEGTQAAVLRVGTAEWGSRTPG